MSDYDRGPYTPPSEPPLAFDARKPQRGRGGPAPVTLIVSVLVLLVAAGGAFFVYRGGARGPSDAPQPVGAPVRDVKVAAPPEAQPQDAASGLSVYKDGAGAQPAAPNFAPPPEAPAPRPVSPAGTLPTPPAAPAPTAATAPAAPPAKPTTIAAILDRPTPPVRGAAPAAKPVTPPAKPATPIAKPAPATVGGAYVQIGAFSSRDLADKGWRDAARIAPAAMAGKGEHVEAVPKDGGGTVFRTTVTGFGSKAEASALCDQLKAAGKACFVR